MLVPIDEPPDLTEEEEAGIEEAIASIEAGEGIPFDEAERAALDEAIARAWASAQAGEGRLAADVLKDLGKG